MRIVIDTTRHILLNIILVSLFVLVVVLVIAYARGYRLNPQEGTITSTGILSINSSPKAAKILLNGVLEGATDTNLTLPFGTYTVEVQKEGYTSWKKTVSLKGEIVMSLNANLFSKNPSLTPLTNLGVARAIAVGTTDRILLVTESGDVEKDGMYLFEPSSQPLTIFPPLKLLILKSLLPENIDMTTAEVVFDPTFKRAMVTMSDIEDETTRSYLISLDEQNLELFDVSDSKEDIVMAWQAESNREMLKVLETLPKAMHKVATDSFSLISLSPDEKKLLYVAKTDATIPLIIDPPLIGASQTGEKRAISKGHVYVYDKKEDKNFEVPLSTVFEIPADKPTPIPVANSDTLSGTPTPTPAQVVHPELEKELRQQVMWYPTSDYLVIKEKTQITTIQYDGGNKATVYAGPFEPEYFGVSGDANLMVVINLNPKVNPLGDLYSVGIR